MRQGFRVIDSDTHVSPSLDVLLRYADGDLRDRRDDLRPYTRMAKPQPGRGDPEDVESPSSQPRIEQLLKARQSILCQVTKNPIAHKGARLTQEVSLPGRNVLSSVVAAAQPLLNANARSPPSRAPRQVSSAARVGLPLRE